jgi:hypothetical protein
VYGRNVVSFNPYQPPVSAHAEAPGTDAAVSNRIVEAMRKAKPWVSLVAISGFVLSIVWALLGLAMLLGSPDDDNTIAVGVSFFVWSGLMFGASIPLYRYGRGIRRLLHGGGMAELELALEAQAKFWQLAGFVTLLSLVLLIGAAVLVFLAAAVLTSIF